MYMYSFTKLLMGIKSSKDGSRQNASVNYAGSESDILEDVPSILGGSIHSLCAGEQSILVTGGSDQVVVVYDWSKHTVCSRLGGPQKCITKVTCNSAGPGLVHAGSRDHRVYGWSWARTAAPPSPLTNPTDPSYVLEGHTQAVTALASSRVHGQYLCSGGRDTALCLWDLPTKCCVSRVDSPRNLVFVTDVCWLDPEMAILQAGEDLTLKVWDLRAATLVQQFAPKPNILTCCAVSSDGNYFLSGTNGSGGSSELTLWDRRTGKALRDYQGHSEGVLGCIFVEASTGGMSVNRELIASCSNDRTVRIWSKDDKACLNTHYVDGAGPITAVVSPSRDMGVNVWSLILTEKESQGKCSLSLRASY